MLLFHLFYSCKTFADVKLLNIKGTFRVRRALPFLLVLFNFPCLAAYDGNFEPRVEEVKNLPSHLFHWIGRRSINSWASKIENRKQNLIFPYQLKEESQFVHLWKAFSQSRGVFTWVDPVLGSQGPNHESYSTDKDLVMFKISSKAKAIRLISDGNTSNDYSEIIVRAGIQPKQVQLIEHITPNLHEWILVDPKAVENFTAAPHITYVKVWEAMQPFLKNPAHRPPLSEIHFRYDGSLNPTWVNSIQPQNGWALSIVLMRLVRNLIINPDSPYYSQKFAKMEVPRGTFQAPLANPMKRPMPIKCEKLFSDFAVPSFDINAVNKRIGEYRK